MHGEGAQPAEGQPTGGPTLGGQGTGRTTDGRAYRLVLVVDVPSVEIRVRPA